MGTEIVERTKYFIHENLIFRENKVRTSSEFNFRDRVFISLQPTSENVSSTHHRATQVKHFEHEWKFSVFRFETFAYFYICAYERDFQPIHVYENVHLGIQKLNFLLSGVAHSFPFDSTGFTKVS